MASDNGGAHAALTAQIDALRDLKRAPEEIAPEVASELEDVIKAQIARGESPDGVAWQKNKDGTQPLKTAGKALTVVARGAQVFAEISGHVALHHFGRARGRIKRQVLPTNTVPGAAAAAIKAVYAGFMSRKLKGKR